MIGERPTYLPNPNPYGIPEEYLRNTSGIPEKYLRISKEYLRNI